METHEQRQAAYLEQVRAKYSADELKALGAKGQAFKNANGDWSYPIADLEDLHNAIHAVGRGGADHDAIRAYIIRRAKALGASDQIPDNWGANGSLKDANAAKPEGETRDDADYFVALEDLAPYAVEATADGFVVADAPPRNPATPKRAFSSLLEQPPSHDARIEVRMDGEQDAHIARFAGYASTTGVGYSVTDWLGEYRETMQPGAFAKTLREQSNIPVLFNHDGIPLASTGSGTSSLSEDGTGLRNVAEFDRRDALTNSVCVQLSRGVLSKMSFSFRAVKDAWSDDYDERAVQEAQLFDTSIVTYPANDTTSAGLVDAMRSAMGREGRSLWLAEHELSVRSALPAIMERRQVSQDGEDLLERALRALAHADEVVCRSCGPHGRARTFLVAGALTELRAGKVLSAKNEALLQGALDALQAADKPHRKVAQQHAKAAENLSSVLNPESGDGTANGTPPGNGNPILPQDGAGPRSRSLKLRRERERELRELRRR